MKMSKDKKKEILLKNFEIIKEDYENNQVSIAKLMSEMLAIDAAIATDMWVYLLNTYGEYLKGEDSWFLTGSIACKGSDKIGDIKMDKIILDNPIIKRAMFALSCDGIHDQVGEIIGRRVSANDLQIADELLQMVYENPYKNSDWYSIMDRVLDGVDVLAENGYELLEMWCEKAGTKTERAKLSVRMLEFLQDDDEDEDNDF